jgi:hypothetical protein
MTTTFLCVSGFAAGIVAGVCLACWRLRGATGFVASLSAVLRTGGQGEER